MHTDGTLLDLYRIAIARFGEQSQLDMVIEEAAELQKAILKFKRAIKMPSGIQGAEAQLRLADIAEETADLEIMLEQLHLMMKDHDPTFNKRVESYRVSKVAKLRSRLGVPLVHA